jgi:NadR type nicotinamide-nucleotide adenylyltransferase
MEAHARTGDVIRVVLTGSESTGKTTLGNELARRYEVELAPEFVRSFAEQRGGVIRFEDHGPIARGQMQLEDDYTARARGVRPLVLFDTDLLSTVVYCNHYFGQCPRWIADAARERRPDLYLLCEIDAPWIADGVRDRGEQREEMQALFRNAVVASGAPYLSLHGDIAARMSQAATTIDRLIAT